MSHLKSKIKMYFCAWFLYLHVSECILTLQLKIQSKCRFCIYRNWLLYCAPISKSVLSIHIAYHQLEGASKDTPCTLSFILFAKKTLVIALTLSLSLKKFNNISHSANRQIVTPVIFFQSHCYCCRFLCFCDSFSLCYLLLVACPFLTFLAGEIYCVCPCM